MTTALIIVDVQNDFIIGSLPVDDGDEVAVDIADYLDSPAGRSYDYVVTTQDWHINPGDHFSDEPDFKTSWPVHCVAGTEGAALHDAIRYRDVDARFYKGQNSAAYSGFEGIGFFRSEGREGKEQSLGAWLLERLVDEVHIVGIATDFCVKATALDARKVFITRVIIPLTAAVSAEGLSEAATELTNAGVHLSTWFA